MFLNPQNTAFRNHIVGNIKYNSAVIDFWGDFFKRRERDQQEMVDAALTRVNTLLTHPYIRHIVGQKETTMSFEYALKSMFPPAWLVKLSANLPADIKKFIGTLFISELLHAVRNRPENKRQQYCIFVDEFQNFTGADDFTTLITEARKFGIATTIAHQERFGQFANNQKLLGATLAAVNKVFFQLTVKDAEELAPEFAQKADDTRTRLGGELVNSPHVIEDIWERGHPDEKVMQIREKYFWIVDLLKSKPQESYYLFDPKNAKATKGNNTNLAYENFDDWETYRSSREMLRQGISLLNKYYYECMQNGFKKGVIGNEELQMFLKIIECFSGVYGMRPTMEPFIPDDMRHVFLRRANEHGERRFKEFVDEVRRKNQETEQEYNEWDRKHPFRNRNDPWGQYEGEMPLSTEELQKLFRKNKPVEWTLTDIPHAVSLEYIEKMRGYAISVGLTQSEFGELIQWQIKPLHAIEAPALTELVTIVSNIDADNDGFEKNELRVNQQYAAVMAQPLILARFGEYYDTVPFEEKAPYLQIVTKRIIWQMKELNHFILYCLRALPSFLARSPIKIQSAQYDEEPKREKTQAELIDEAALELGNLPRYTAYAKEIDESKGEQVVLKQKIKTLPLPPLHLSDIESRAIANGHSLCKERVHIESEIRERQEKWRRTGSAPSAEEPRRRRN